jgi:hypothetical protein
MENVYGFMQYENDAIRIKTSNMHVIDNTVKYSIISPQCLRSSLHSYEHNHLTVYYLPLECLIIISSKCMYTSFSTMSEKTAGISQSVWQWAGGPGFDFQ